MKFLCFLLALFPVLAKSQGVAPAPWYGGIHPVAVNWGFRILKNGGAFPTQKNLIATGNFLEAIDPDLPQIIAINPFLPESLTSAITPLVVGPGFDPWVNHAFVAGDITVNGLTGNGSTKYLDTGISWSNTAKYWGSNHFGAEYGIKQNVTASGFSGGVYDGVNGASVHFFNPFNPGPSFQCDYWNADGSTPITNISQTYLGLLMGERYDLTHQTNYNLVAASGVYRWTGQGKNTTALNEIQTNLTLYLYAANGGTAQPPTPGGFQATVMNWAGFTSALSNPQAERYATNALILRQVFGGAWN